MRTLWSSREESRRVKARDRSEARSVGSSRRRRGASAAILDGRARDGAAWRDRDASGEARDRERPGGATRAQHAAGGLGVRRQRRHWENREGDGVRADS